MTEFKTIKVSAEAHKTLKIIAAQKDIKIYEIIDKLLVDDILNLKET